MSFHMSNGRYMAIWQHELNVFVEVEKAVNVSRAITDWTKRNNATLRDWVEWQYALDPADTLCLLGDCIVAEDYQP